MNNLNYNIENQDQLILRKIMGKFATGVAIATTIDNENKPIGITINSLTSVSLNPPLLLFCITKNSSTLNAFQTSQNFAINIMAENQIELSRRFAKNNFDKFENIEIKSSHNKMPIFENSLAIFDCKKNAQYDGGDHIIFLGEIENAQAELNNSPLIYFSGHYEKIEEARENDL